MSWIEGRENVESVRRDQGETAQGQCGTSEATSGAAEKPVVSVNANLFVAALGMSFRGRGIFHGPRTRLRQSFRLALASPKWYAVGSA
jgi:hypothetical protein